MRPIHIWGLGGLIGTLSALSQSASSQTPPATAPTEDATPAPEEPAPLPPASRVEAPPPSEKSPKPAPPEESTQPSAPGEPPEAAIPPAEGESETGATKRESSLDESSSEQETKPASESETEKSVSAEQTPTTDAGDEPTPQPQSGPNSSRTSASANRKNVEKEDDDYESVSADKLVEEPDKRKDLMLGVMLDLTAPLGDSADFVGDVSITGFSIDLRYYLNDHIGIGAAAGFDNISKKTSGTVVWDNITSNATQLRELSHTPIVVKGYYAWRDREKYTPYVAFGAGASRVTKTLRVGFSRLREDGWHWGFVPEAGLHVKAGSAVLVANVRLHTLVGNGDGDSYMFGNFSFGVSVQ